MDAQNNFHTNEEIQDKSFLAETFQDEYHNPALGFERKTMFSQKTKSRIGNENENSIQPPARYPIKSSFIKESDLRKTYSKRLSHRNILHHFRNQLKQNQLLKTRIEWYKLTAEDFVNWPKHLPIKPPNQYKNSELEILLSQLNTIIFSEQYLQMQKVSGTYVR